MIGVAKQVSNNRKEALKQHVCFHQQWLLGRSRTSARAELTCSIPGPSFGALLFFLSTYCFFPERRLFPCIHPLPSQ